MSKHSHDSGETTTFQSKPHSVKQLTVERSELPVIQLGTKESNAEFRLDETLGEGGIGRVVSARQHALQRSVAVKFLKERPADEEALVREAVVMGRLEHPNIVPVHVLGRTPDGVPFFSMKRVEGTPWSEALHDGRTIVEHLEVLQRVCDAVAFAHSRDVIHRDIKPANVLLGSFGEVYLGDWGLAAALRPDSVLPLASEAGVGGTPAYLAPEMTSPEGPLGAWTDVFLLGATLYEVLNGRPPWLANSPTAAMVLAARANEPPFEPSVPSELASICRRAMRKNPAERFESALAFKDAITGYLRHREVSELHERALTRLTDLERTVMAEEGDPQARAISAQRLFTECRFAFEQVRTLWPEFEPARRGQRKALVLMIRHELKRGVPSAARVLLAELDEAPAELVAAVDEAERREQERAKRLSAFEQHARASSTEAVRAPKAKYIRGVAVTTLLMVVGAQVLESTGAHRFTPFDGLIFSLLLLLNSVGYRLWLRRLADVNQLQLGYSNALTGLSTAGVVSWLAVIRFDIGFRFGLLTYLVINAASWWAGAASGEERLPQLASRWQRSSASSFPS
jgi:hypothetical protein